MADQYTDKVVVFQGEDGMWRYHAQSNNGEILFTSEAYDSKSNAERGAKALAVDAGTKVVEEGT